MRVDTSFDFRADAAGRDPDTYSPTLRRYHRILWSKPLPTGQLFHLVDNRPGAYLYHCSDAGEFFMASDSIIPTYTGWKSLRQIIESFPEEENEAFRRIGYSIGGMMLFPAKRIGGKLTINGARGFNRKIADRFDLTLECIRRHYSNQNSPLDEVLLRYQDFFLLFNDFSGYVDFFLLQDLVSEDGSSIKFFTPFEDFRTPSVPTTIEIYQEYRRRSLEFVQARNRRISHYAA